MQKIHLVNKTKSKFPNLPLLVLKKQILGEKYELSIALVGKAKSRTLNSTYRHKNNPTNVLSFPLSKTSGELVLCPEVIQKEATNGKFEKNYKELCLFLVIHGMLHLKGLKHGKKMELLEKKYLSKTKI